jgi:YggT family protein
MMLDLIFLLLDTACGFLSFALLTRFILQWVRASFRNPLGQFVFAVTDWMVRPARRFIPSVVGLDSSSLVLAWLWQAAYLGLFFGLSRILSDVSPGAVLIVAALAAVETVKIGVYVVMTAVIISAIFSWVNPYAPLASVFNSMTRPVLRPFQRWIPPVGGVDLSPLALLLLLQVATFLLNGARLELIPFLRG